MVSAIEAITAQVKSGLCFVLGNAEEGAAFVSRVYGTSFGAYQGASGLRRLLCSDDPDNDPTYEPPFEGGQCVEKYIVEYTLDAGGPSPSTGTLLAIGPIQGLIEEPQPSGSVRVFLRANSGVVFGGQCFNVLFPSGPQNTLLGTYTPSGGSTSRIEGLTPCGADNCGDPAPVLPPPTEYVYEPGDITYNIDGDTNITVPFTAIFAPVFLDFDGSIRVPVKIDLGGLSFDGTVSIAPTFNVEIKPSFEFGGPGAPDDPDVIGEPGGGAEPIEDVEELDSTIVGVLIFSDIASEAMPSGIEFLNGPDLYVPRLATVQFAIKTADSIGWTSALDAKNLECYVPCPAPQGAVAVRVSPMPGVQSRFTAVRGRPLTSF